MKKLITLLLVLVMALSLGACTAKEAEAPEVEVTMTDDAVAEEAPAEEAMLEGPIKIGVLSPTSGPGSVTQAKKMELGFTCMGGDGWDGIQENYAVEAEGFYFANHYSQDDPSDIVQNFITNYTAEYEETPNALGALAYDAVYLMADAIEAAGSTDSEAIVAALASTTLSGVTGDISFDANGDPIKSVAMIKVVDGALTLDSKVAAK